ncbi:SCP2 sterol-binding domain-containing protein [Candidatus Bathyarchaeota archaeon A05DMB-2]|jgi:putative sterol carrier protein|nr:SCP2 sterol-binding domain-containing protein [Candidatus Bathyarchaeota archaeon A05DMB-2]
MEVKTPREFFEKVLPSRFKPDKAAGIDVTVQVSIVGPNGGDWIVTIKNQQLQVKEGTLSSPTLQVKMSEKDYLDVINGKLSGERAFFTRKLQINGDIGIALKLRNAGFF